MTETGQEKIIAFDTLFTTNQIQMLKILLTYVDPSQQKNMAVYIKFLELQYTLTFFQQYPSSPLKFPKDEKLNVSTLCDEILPLCNPSQQEMLNNMKNMYQSYENMQEMMQMVQMMKELYPDGDISNDNNPMSMFSGLFGSDGMDMSGLFEMFQNK